jgi:hypothetical protein
MASGNANTARAPSLPASAVNVGHWRPGWTGACPAQHVQEPPGQPGLVPVTSRAEHRAEQTPGAGLGQGHQPQRGIPFACGHWTEAICQAPLPPQAKPGGQREYQATDGINAYAEEHGALVTPSAAITMTARSRRVARCQQRRSIGSSRPGRIPRLSGRPGDPARTEASRR